MLAAWQRFSSTVPGQADEFVDGRIFVDVRLLTIVDAHGSVGRFCPRKEGKFLVRQGKMPGDKCKACPGQGEVAGFTGGGTEDVVQLVIDRDDVMPTGEDML